MLQSKTPKTRQEIMEQIQGFCIFDDFLMTAVFNNDPECAEVLIRTILGRSDLKVKSVHTKHYIKNLYGHSAELDIFAEDTDGNPYDIEFQKADEGARPMRARLYSSLMDANIPDPGIYGDRLPESYVIFITLNDIYKRSLPLYSVNRMIEETGMKFEDKQHIMYVNGQNRSDTELGRLVQDFFCTKADEIQNRVLSEKVRFYKEDPKGVENMMETYKDLSELIAEEVAYDKSVEIAERLIVAGKLSVEEIAESTGLSLEDVTELAKEVG
ncbi:MAG: hypothetical protein J6X33_04435 [Clostridiales bacterium]|nr:hypothetical protein [Clostridiales bacterium]